MVTATVDKSDAGSEVLHLPSNAFTLSLEDDRFTFIMIVSAALTLAWYLLFFRICPRLPSSASSVFPSPVAVR
jgi:hypothetical protein